MTALEKAKKFVHYGGHIDILIILIGLSVACEHSPGTDIFRFTALLFGETWAFIGLKWFVTDITKACEDPK